MLVRHRLNGVEYWATPKMTIVSKDIFSLEYLYYMLHEWLVEHSWCDRSDKDFRETYYEQRDFGGGPREIWVRWRLKKESKNIRYKDALFSYELDIDMHALGVKPTDVVVKGKKLGGDTGEMEVNIQGRVIMNPKYFKTDLLKQIFKYIIKRPFKNRYDAHQTDLANELTRLQEAVKTYFQIETYLDERQLEQFHLSKSQENL